MSRILMRSLALFEYLLPAPFSGSSSSPSPDASLMAFFLLPPFPLLEEVTLTEPGEVGSEEYGELGMEVIPPDCVECAPVISPAFLFLAGFGGRRGGGGPGYPDTGVW